MEYIIFDLEWNQCPAGKEYEVDELPFEILEIGAVKLNKDRTEISRFHERIRPVVYLQMHFRTREILNINMESLKNARTFPSVFADFMAWCGDNPVFCTWGPSDLYELQRNLSYHGLTNPFKKPLFYYDVQKLFAVARGEYKIRRSLEHAADCLQLPRDMSFHSALGDAVYTAQIFRTLETDLIRKNYSVDFYQNPKNRREEIFASYDDHTLFLSKEFSSKTQVMRDRKVCTIRCAGKMPGGASAGSPAGTIIIIPCPGVKSTAGSWARSISAELCRINISVSERSGPQMRKPFARSWIKKKRSAGGAISDKKPGAYPHPMM